MPKLFVSYRHSQAEWVWRCLKPCLEAGGAEVLIDRERFQAGQEVLAQMDTIQDVSDQQIMVLTTDYFDSPACTHELKQAAKLDPTFALGKVILIRRDGAKWPTKITKHNPLYVDLRDGSDSSQWHLLLRSSGLSLGVPALAWLSARDEIVTWLSKGESVNLITAQGAAWRPLLHHIRDATIPAALLPDLKIVEMDSGAAASRRGLLTMILAQFGIHSQLPDKPEDLVEFDRRLDPLHCGHLALVHFDIAATRERRKAYGNDLFAALRNLTMTKKKLVLLVQSRAPFATIVPRDLPISEIDFKTVELP